MVTAASTSSAGRAAVQPVPDAQRSCVMTIVVAATLLWGAIIETAKATQESAGRRHEQIATVILAAVPCPIGYVFARIGVT